MRGCCARSLDLMSTHVLAACVLVAASKAYALPSASEAEHGGMLRRRTLQRRSHGADARDVWGQAVVGLARTGWALLQQPHELSGSQVVCVLWGMWGAVGVLCGALWCVLCTSCRWQVLADEVVAVLRGLLKGAGGGGFGRKALP